MATVRFSNDLRSSIRRNADKLFEGRTSKLYQEVTPTDIYQRICEPLLAPIVQKCMEIPEGFLRYTKEVIIFLQCTSRAFRTDHVLVEPVPIPERAVTLKEGVTVESSYRTVTFRVKSAFLPEDMRESISEKVAVLASVQNEQDVFYKNLDKLINHYTTLAPALKEWPPLWDLLPSDVQDRHKAITEKRKRSSAKEELDLSLDRMTGTVVANKLAGKL